MKNGRAILTPRDLLDTKVNMYRTLDPPGIFINNLLITTSMLWIHKTSQRHSLPCII